jgi:hypothetical protein
MFLDIIHRPAFILNTVLFILQKHEVSETGFCLRLQVKPIQLGPIDWASPYLRTPVPAPRRGTQAKHSTNHLRELRQNIKILKLHTYEALHQRTLKMEVITGETNSPYGTNTRNTNIPTKSTLNGVVVFYFCCTNGSPHGRDVQAGLSDRMVYQRHVVEVLVFPVCGVGLNLQDFHFIPTYFVAFFICMLG